MMRSLCLAIALGTALLCTLASADQPTIIPRIGVFSSSPFQTADEGLRDGLRELGYLEGKNITIEWRRSLGTEEELRSVARELAQVRVGLIVVFSTLGARAALQATTIPVVFLAGDPVAAGLATSLAHPGGRGTGVSMLNSQLTGKRMEVLRQVAPPIRRIIFLMDPSNPLNTRVLEEAHKAARTLGVEVATLGARNADELDIALHAISRSATDGLLISNDLLLLANKAKVTEAVRKAKLPAVNPLPKLTPFPLAILTPANR